MDDIEALLQQTRAKIDRVVGMSGAETAGRRATLEQVAAYVADRAGLLPRGGIAAALGKSPGWVSYAIMSTEARVAASYAFRVYVEKLIQAVNS